MFLHWHYSNEKQEAVLNVSNPAAITKVGLDSEEYGFYEHVDVEGEPQYESLEEYDRLGIGANKSLPVCADCPAYEPTVTNI